MQYRGNLDEELRNNLHRLSRGFHGEKLLLEHLQRDLKNNPITLFNLRLIIDGSEVQIDCIMIFQQEIIILEIKNYRGNFYFNNEEFFVNQKTPIKNPIHQLNRTKMLFSTFLKDQQIPLKLTGYVVFINSEFHLYHSPSHLPIIYAPQIKEFLRACHNKPCKLNQLHERMKLIFHTHHQENSIYERQLDRQLTYEIDSIKKGILCKRCGIRKDLYAWDVTCHKCMHTENLADAVIKTIEEFQTLFPDQKVTIQNVADWTDNIVSKYRLRKILVGRMEEKGKGRNTHYIFT